MPTKHDILLKLQRLTNELVSFQQLLRQEHTEEIKQQFDKTVAEMHKCIEEYERQKLKNQF